MASRLNLFLPWLFSLYQNKPAVYTFKPKQIYLRINHLQPDKPLAVESPPVKPPDTDVVATPSTPQLKTQDLRRAKALPAPISTEPMDAGQLHTLIQQNKMYRDADLSDHTAGKPSVTTRSSHHFEEVFHPGLRAKLQNNAMHRSETKYQAGGESMNIHGNTFVDTGGGRCLMAVSAGSSEVTDWYKKECPGYKDEGDKIMERVNNKVRKVR